MRPQSDEELIRTLGEGDENALRTLVERHTPSIFRFSVRHTGDESIAQDICQEVFLKLYRNARSYKPGMTFKTWLFTIVRNTSIDMARSYTYRKAYSLEDYSQKTERQPLINGAPDPEQRYSSKETAQKVTLALQSLPEKQRTACILKYYEEMPTKKIAEAMRTTVSSVESLLVRAKHNLLKLLQI
jgi:RNA polymerase sigma-70 factor, ECF subfamily